MPLPQEWLLHLRTGYAAWKDKPDLNGKNVHRGSKVFLQLYRLIQGSTDRLFLEDDNCLFDDQYHYSYLIAQLHHEGTSQGYTEASANTLCLAMPPTQT